MQDGLKDILDRGETGSLVFQRKTDTLVNMKNQYRFEK